MGTYCGSQSSRPGPARRSHPCKLHRSGHTRGACRSTGRCPGDQGRRWDQVGGSQCTCTLSPQHVRPQTHQLALGNSTQCTPGVTAAAWGRGRAGLSWGGDRRAWTPWGQPSPPWPPRSLPQPLILSPGRLTGAAFRVARIQPPEPRFTAIAAWAFHMSPARTGGLCLGENETEGQSGSLPSYL